MTSLVRHLPCTVHVLRGKHAAYGSPLDRIVQRGYYGKSIVDRFWFGKPKAHAATQSYLRSFARLRPQAVVAQYGPLGVTVLDACRSLQLPLIVFFRGNDATCRPVVNLLREEYRCLFAQAHWLVAVAPSIRDALVRLGAPAEKIVVQPSGAECKQFFGARPAHVDPHFVSVGRFVPKKAPHRVIEAFATARQQREKISLTMIGEGPLLSETRKLAHSLGITSAVRFLGVQSQLRVAQEMRQSRAALQHSVVAPNGDSEGTPVSVMEAGASGLPVIATRHAGIPDVVLHGRTGLLVAEHDVNGMADAIVRLTDDQQLAGALGAAARQRITRHFSVQSTANAIFQLIERSSYSVPGVASTPLNACTADDSCLT